MTSSESEDSQAERKSQDAATWSVEKKSLRVEAKSRLEHFTERSEASRAIFTQLESLPEFQQAQHLMSFVSMDHEVDTRHTFLPRWLGRKHIAIPYIQGDALALFRLTSLAELSPARMGILEPLPDLRSDPRRQVDRSSLQCIIVPGLGFDRRGGRLGYGKGYYDRLLSTLSPSVFLVGVAYAVQWFDTIPQAAHDVPMDCVITEEGIHRVLST